MPSLVPCELLSTSRLFLRRFSCPGFAWRGPSVKARHPTGARSRREDSAFTVEDAVSVRGASVLVVLPGVPNEQTLSATGTLGIMEDQD